MAKLVVLCLISDSSCSLSWTKLVLFTVLWKESLESFLWSQLVTMHVLELPRLIVHHRCRQGMSSVVVVNLCLQ